MARRALGELEHLVMVAIVRLGEGAYGAAVIAEIESHTNRDLSHAATYLALQRLQEKNLIASRAAVGDTARGGRAKSIFTLTRLGRERLRESAADIFTMWRGVNPALRSKTGS